MVFRLRLLGFEKGSCCPACGGPSTSRLLLIKKLPALIFPVDDAFRESIPRKNLDIRRCAGCRHEYAIGNPKRFLRKIYEVFYHFYPMHAEGLFEESYRSPMREALDEILESFADQKLRVLEVGANEAGSLSQLGEFGHTVLGVSPDAPAEDAQFFRCALENLVTDEKFDLIVSRFTLEHIANLDSHLAKTKELLRPGGRLVIQVPNCEQFRATGVKWYFAHEHRHYFNTMSLRLLLQRNGFDSRVISGKGEQSIISVSQVETMNGTKVSWHDGIFDKDSNCENLVFYGAGLPLLEWVYLSKVPIPSNVEIHVVDDNPATHGRLLPHSGLAVKGPSTIPNEHTTTVVISVNPFYYDAIKSRIEKIAPKARVIEMSQERRLEASA